MSTKARKARKRAGEKFVKPTKVGTPLENRAITQVWKKGPDGKLGWYPSNREMKRRESRRLLLADAKKTARRETVARTIRKVVGRS